MAVLAVQDTVLTGGILTLAAAAGGGDSFVNDGRTTLVVNNGSGSSINVTITSPTPCSHGGLHDLVVAVGAGVQKGIGPFSVERFGASVAIAYSLATSITVAARRTL
jgi:hypothetical protein